MAVRAVQHAVHGLLESVSWDVQADRLALHAGYEGGVVVTCQAVGADAGHSVASRLMSFNLDGLDFYKPSLYGYFSAVGQNVGCTFGDAALLDIYPWLPPEAVKILLVLFLSFMIGLEREEHKAAAGHYAFGGVQASPLIGLIGYSVALVSGAQPIPLMLGFLVVGGFLLLSYWRKLSSP